MRLTSATWAFSALLAFTTIGCEQPSPDRSETAEPATTAEPAAPNEGDAAGGDAETSGTTPAEAPASPEPATNEEEASGGLEMPADAAPDQADAAAASRPDPLKIGSPAPPLDVEHWVQLGNGKYEPIQEFKDGKVYIVEFWATWCGPCIASMPHLAETQQQYADQGVRLISVSDEPLETVEKFLDTEVRSSTPTAEAAGQEEAGEEAEEADQETYRELTSVYSLTTDPDRSTHAAYMEAANQRGIPTAFIVGKSGEVEWIGHPMRMDEPLQQIVDGSWDRAEYAEQMELESQITEAQNLMRQGQMQEGLAMVNRLLDQIEDPDTLLGLKFFKLQALIAMEDKSEEVAMLATGLLDSASE